MDGRYKNVTVDITLTKESFSKRGGVSLISFLRFLFPAQPTNHKQTNTIFTIPNKSYQTKGYEELKYERLLKVRPEVKIKVILGVRKATKVLNLMVFKRVRNFCENF